MTDTIRIDKWLWHARLAKTRSLAARLCESGQVQLGVEPAPRPARQVRPGDRLTVSHGGWRRRVEILAIGARRGPAEEARALYAETAPPERLSRADPGWEPLLAEE